MTGASDVACRHDTSGEVTKSVRNQLLETLSTGQNLERSVMNRGILCTLATLLCFSWIVESQSWWPWRDDTQKSQKSREKESNGILVRYEVRGPVGSGIPLTKYNVQGTIMNTGRKAFPRLQLRIGDTRDFANQPHARFRPFIKDWCVYTAPGESKNFSIVVENHRSDDLIDVQIWPDGWPDDKLQKSQVVNHNSGFLTIPGSRTVFFGGGSNELSNQSPPEKCDHNFGGF
jgi:hypothetical protein